LVSKVAEVFEDGMLAQTPKVIAFFQKRMKDTSDTNMQAVVAESLGKSMSCIIIHPNNQEIA